MASKTFSTEGLAPAHQFDAWQAWFSPTLDMRPRDRGGDGFRATNRVWNLGGLVVSSVSAPAALVDRNRSNIARDPADHWVLTFCKQGTTQFETRRGTLQANGGEAFIWCLGERSRSERSRVDRIQVLLPRDRFRHIGHVLDRKCGSVVRGELGGVLSTYLATLEEWLPLMSSEALPQLGEGVANVVAACLAPDSESDGGNRLDDVRALRVRQAIIQNLKAPKLGSDELCRMLGMSRSALYRLFEGVGGVARYIQRERLLHAYARLSDPQSNQSIAALSQELCFADSAGFSRAFKREFGTSPSEVRWAARAQPGILVDASLRSDEFLHFGEFLRNPH